MTDLGVAILFGGIVVLVTIIGPLGMLLGCLWAVVGFVLGVIPLVAALAGVVHFEAVLVFWLTVMGGIWLSHLLRGRHENRMMMDITAPRESSLPSVEGELIEDDFEAHHKEEYEKTMRLYPYERDQKRLPR